MKFLTIIGYSIISTIIILLSNEIFFNGEIRALLWNNGYHFAIISETIGLILQIVIIIFIGHYILNTNKINKNQNKYENNK